MPTTRIAVTASDAATLAKAEQLARRLHLDLMMHADTIESSTYDYLLLLTHDYLGLCKTSDKLKRPFYIDFLSPKMQHRRDLAGRKNEMLARAISIRPRDNPIIIDATAGLGRDSFILAALGFQITLLERSPILCALLEDAIVRGKQHPETEAIMSRMHLIQTDAIDWLAQLTAANRPDVVYMDPMFPERKKAASVKKEMVILQNLLGKDTDAENLLDAALACAKRRVVVKRPRLAEVLGKNVPSYNLVGKSSRFDIYLV